MRAKGQVRPVLQVAPQVFRALVATAMRTSQVTGNKCISSAVSLIMLAAGAFNVFDVVAQAAHQAAEETGTQRIAEFSE
jgi:hypothetical protein